MRANIMVYFLPQAVLAMVMYYWSGLFTGETITLSVLLGLPFVLAMAAGVYSFHGSSEALYRRVAYVIIALAGWSACRCSTRCGDLTERYALIFCTSASDTSKLA